MANIQRFTAIDLSMSRFIPTDDVITPPPEPEIVLRFSFDETHRVYSLAQNGVAKLRSITRPLSIRSTNHIPLADMFKSDSPYCCHVLPSSEHAIYGIIEREMTSAVRWAAKMEAFEGVEGRLGVRAKVEVTVDCYEPAKICSTCLADLESDDEEDEGVTVAECGHSYHIGCMIYYWDLGIECPECYRGNTEPLLIRLEPKDDFRFDLDLTDLLDEDEDEDEDDDEDDEDDDDD